jgi:putrescine aminotransferase
MAFFASSGSEAVEGALKLARIVTGRTRFVSAENSFHGTTMGALSVTGNVKRRRPYGQLLDCAYVPWGRADAIARELRNHDVAAVILEPIQAEGGMNLPPAGYLAEVARMCRKHGTLLIIDEIQTGFGRTGRMFACEEERVEPDVLLVAKALSGGMAPISAYLTRPDLWTKAYGTLQRYDLHCSTFSGGPISCAAALATLEVLERDKLVKKAADLGIYLGDRLRTVTANHPIVRNVRGRGLMWGVELGAVGGPIGDLVAQWLVVGLLERGVLTQVCEGDTRVMRVQPALIAERAHVDRFADALAGTLKDHARTTTSSLAGVAMRAVRNQIATMLGREN